MLYQSGPLEVVPFLESNWIVNCCGIASASLVFYDQLCMLPHEIELMWGRRFSSVTLLFYLNRWATFIWAVTILLNANLGNPKFESPLLQRSSRFVYRISEYFLGSGLMTHGRISLAVSVWMYSVSSSIFFCSPFGQVTYVANSECDTTD